MASSWAQPGQVALLNKESLSTSQSTGEENILKSEFEHIVNQIQLYSVIVPLVEWSLLCIVS